MNFQGLIWAVVTGLCAVSWWGFTWQMQDFKDGQVKLFQGRAENAQHIAVIENTMVNMQKTDADLAVGLNNINSQLKDIIKLILDTHGR